VGPRQAEKFRLAKVFFGGDTGYRSVPNGEVEDKVPVYPVFKEIGQKFGGSL
jgi:N-acyl-phosphatidylethanolamine-hydrolysing phospholipase D